MKLGILPRAVVALGLVNLVAGAPIRPIFPRDEPPPPQPAPVDQPAPGQPLPVKYPDFAAPVERPAPVPPVEQPIPLLLVEQPAPVPPVEQPPIPEPIPPPQHPAAAPAPPANEVEELVTMVYTVTVPASQATSSPTRKVFVKTFASDPLATSYPPPQDGPLPIDPSDPAYEGSRKKKEDVIFPDQDGGPRAPLDWTPSSGAVEEGAYKPPPRHYAPRPDLVPHDPNLKPIEYSAYEPPVAYYRPDAVDFEAPAGSSDQGWQPADRPGRSIYDEEWIDAENSGLSMLQGEPRPGRAYSGLGKPQQPVESEPYEMTPHQQHQGPVYLWPSWGGKGVPHETLTKQEQERQQAHQDTLAHNYNQANAWNGPPSVREQGLQTFDSPGYPSSSIHPFEHEMKLFYDPGNPG
ncbi:hypothetical protein F5X68DRAFT_251837 [Plectosphaerella plurivora]|uniref:Uncharacterized protein n=1 Tax=Plectosphaerella plurivora TaxID=936078 RepID=A0A9P8V113_9PEZI|nr:hypothetical protein F5X68DRAFT_251837 [Plectosphaerella plurivora]